MRKIVRLSKKEYEQKSLTNVCAIKVHHKKWGFLFKYFRLAAILLILKLDFKGNEVETPV